MSFSRRQIGDVGFFNSTNAPATNVSSPSRSVRRGSLLVASFRWETADSGIVVTDNVGGVWTVIKQFSTNVSAALAYSWNHPGGGSVVVSGSFGGSSQSYRRVALVELEGPDQIDPFVFGSVKTTSGPNVSAKHFVVGPPDSDVFTASASYSPTDGEVYTYPTIGLYIPSPEYFGFSRTVGSVDCRYVWTKAFTGKAAHVSAAFRAPTGERNRAAQMRRLWVGAAGGGGTGNATGSLASITIDAATGTATGKATATATPANVSITAPTATATGGAVGNATGALSSVTLAAPTATAAGKAQATAAPASVTLVSPIATATGKGQASGTLAAVSFVAPTGTASASAGGTGNAIATPASITIAPPGATATGAAAAFASFMSVVLTPVSGTASSGVIQVAGAITRDRRTQESSRPHSVSTSRPGRIANTTR